MGFDPKNLRELPQLITPSGNLNIKVKGIESSRVGDLYYAVLNTSWYRFIASFIIIYISLNGLFGTLYYLGGDCIRNATPYSYWDSFMFSVQTSSTIGYGFLAPKTAYANFVVVINSITSLLFVAVMTGLAFARFSRPSAKVMFSHNAIITRKNGQPTLVFRVANTRCNRIVDAKLNVVCLIWETTLEGQTYRKVKSIKLERKNSAVFALTWTVFHPIDEESPFYGKTIQQIRQEGIALVISFTGIDDVFTQTVHARHHYAPETIVSAKGFKDMFSVQPDGTQILDYAHFNTLLS